VKKCLSLFLLSLLLIIPVLFLYLVTEPQVVGLAADPANDTTSVIFSLQAKSKIGIVETSLTYWSYSGERSTHSCLFKYSSPQQSVEQSYQTSIPTLSIEVVTIWYQWTVRDRLGRKVFSSPQSILYDSHKRQWQVVVTPHFRIFYYADEEVARDTVAPVAEKAYLRVMRVLPFAPSHPIAILLFPSRRDMPTSTGKEFGSSAGRYEIRLSPVGKEKLERIITHELTHVVHMAWSNGKRGPAWLEEGLAEYVSKNADPDYDWEKGIILRDLSRNETFHSKEELRKHPHLFALSERQKFYAESQAMVEYLIEDYGLDKLIQLFESLGEGKGTYTAFKEIYGKSMSMVEEEALQAVQVKFEREREWHEKRETQAMPQSPVIEVVPLAQKGSNRPFMWSPDGRWIAYSSSGRGERKGEADIYISDGKREKLLVSGMGRALVRGWSPDSREILFASFQDGKLRLYRQGMTGEEATPVTLWQEGSSAWLSSGDIVFSSNQDGKGWNLYLIPPYGREPKQLTFFSDGVSTPIPAPDGEKIAFFSESDGGYNLYVLDLNNRQLTNICKLEDPPRSISWSPDSAQLVFDQRRKAGREILIINADGTGHRSLTKDDSYNTNPAWLPDGEWIVFASDRSGKLDLYLMRPDGSHVIQLTTDGLDSFAPIPSPDGKRIAYNVYDQGSLQIYLLTLDLHKLKQLGK